MHDWVPRKRRLSEKLEKHREYYRSQHQTRGCRLTHMIGIPMIIFSVFRLPNLKSFLTFFTLGWGLQIIGHKVFEGNSPVVAQEPHKIPETLATAVIFTAEEWIDLIEQKDGNPWFEDKSN